MHTEYTQNQILWLSKATCWPLASISFRLAPILVVTPTRSACHLGTGIDPCEPCNMAVVVERYCQGQARKRVASAGHTLGGDPAVSSWGCSANAKVPVTRHGNLWPAASEEPRPTYMAPRSVSGTFYYPSLQMWPQAWPTFAPQPHEQPWARATQ